MFRLFLEGVYNNGEVMWLELKWLFYSLLRSRIHKHEFAGWMAEYVRIMPSQMLIMYGDFRGTIVWKYKIEGNKVLRFKGWNDSITNNPMEDREVETMIVRLHEQLAYEAIDEHLSS